MINKIFRAYINTWTREIAEIKSSPHKLQRKVLGDILRSKYIEYFHGKLTAQEFNAHPLTSYDDYGAKVQLLLSDNHLRCENFAQSSGTTSGIKKILPTPEIFVRQNHLRGTWYILHSLYEHNADASVFEFKNLLVGGSIYKRKKGYLLADVSGIMLNRIPHYMRFWYVPSIKIATMPDWEEKIRLTSEAAVNVDDVSLLGGIPTWLLSVCRQALAISGKQKISDLWPRLLAYVHGGVSFEPYRHQFEEIIDIPGFRYVEVYNATEGFFAYQDRPDEEGMLLMCADGIYYEFILYANYKNEDYKIIPLSDVRLEEQYVLVITTTAGLVRYVQGDVITFVSCLPYRIKVSGRIKEYINAFGEDLIRAHVEDALSVVSEKHNVSIIDYTIAPRFITINEKGWHDWYIEFKRAPKNIEAFTAELDQALRDQNNNYDQKRTADLALESLRIKSLKEGTIDAYFRSLGKIGGQSKLQKMSNDRDLLQTLDNLSL